jgi:hypothetical protein
VEKQKGWSVEYWNHEGILQRVFLGDVVKWSMEEKREDEAIYSRLFEEYEGKEQQRIIEPGSEKRDVDGIGDNDQESDEAIALALQADIREESSKERARRRKRRGYLRDALQGGVV